MSGHRSGPLSIAYLSPGWPIDACANGIVTYSAAISEELRKLGHWSCIMSGNVAQGVKDDFVYDLNCFRSSTGLTERVLNSVFHRFAPALGSARHIRRIGSLIGRAAAERQVQLVEMEESLGIARWVALESNLPVVVRLHGPWFLTGPNPGSADDHRRIQAEGESLRLAAGITAPSHDVLERARIRYGLPLTTSEVIPNPVAIVPESDRWNFEACDPNLILFVGRFDRLKGGDVIVDAFECVAQTLPKARLCFVGSDRGIDCDGALLGIEEVMRERAPTAWRSGRFEWLGQQPQSALPALRRRAMVTVICSRYETFSMTLVEAMSYGCPVVATRVGGIPEIVEDGVHGLLCDSEDPEGLADRIVTLMRDPDQAAELGRNASARCEQRYSPKVVAAQSVEFYRKVFAQHDDVDSPR